MIKFCPFPINLNVIERTLQTDLLFHSTFSGQRNLEILSLLNVDFGVTDVLRLLGTVAKGSGERLVSLDLRGAFREWQAPHDNPRFGKAGKKKIY